MNKKLFKAVPAFALGCLLMNATTPVVAQTTTSYASQKQIMLEESWTWSEFGGSVLGGAAGGAVGGAVTGAAAGGVGAAPGALVGGLAGAAGGAVGNIVTQGVDYFFGYSSVTSSPSYDYSTALN